LEAHIEYQRGLWYAIYLVYDILEAERGSKNPFKVYRLNPKFLEKILKNNQKITQETIKQLNFKIDKIYEEIPVEILKTPMAQAFLFEKKKEFKGKFSNSQGNLDIYSYFARTISFLSDSLNELTEYDIKNATDANKRLEKKEPNKMELADFIETFSTRQKINNFSTKIANCGKLQLDSCAILSKLYNIKN